MVGIIWKAISILILAYAVRHSLRVIYVTGLFTYRHNHQPGPCRIVPGIEHGSEDIQILPGGIALLTAGMNAGITDTPHKFRGIYMFDFNNPDGNLTKLRIIGNLAEEDFVPHGFHVWTDKRTGIVTVFSTNHGRTYWDNESVEVFTFDKATLSLHHVKTIRDDGFRRLNDIVGTSNSTFYATNDDVRFQGLWKWKIEPFLQTPFGNIVYYDGNSATEVARGFVLANGIITSPDQRTLYMIPYGEANMVVFNRHKDNTLTEVKRVDLHMPRPDNIEIDLEGNLWIAGGYRLVAGDFNRHPNSMVSCRPDNIEIDLEGNLWIAGDYRLVAGDFNRHPNSMVIRGKHDGDDFVFTEVYVNDGSVLDSASVASFYNNQLLIGTPRQRLLYCKASYIF